MKSKLLIVFLKELRETLRDRRALSMLALFTLMYPLMLGFILSDGIKRATKPEREGIELAVIGAEKAPTLMAQLRQKLEADPSSPELLVTEPGIGYRLHCDD